MAHRHSVAAAEIGVAKLEALGGGTWLVLWHNISTSAVPSMTGCDLAGGVGSMTLPTSVSRSAMKLLMTTKR
jgi:hypothetical protein